MLYLSVYVLNIYMRLKLFKTGGSLAVRVPKSVIPGDLQLGDMLEVKLPHEFVNDNIEKKLDRILEILGDKTQKGGV